MIWTFKRLGDLSKVITKGTTPTSIGFDFAEKGIPFLRVENIRNGTVNYEKDTLFVDERTHKALERSQIQTGDILVSIAGTIGRSGVVPEAAPALNCNQAVAILRTNGALFGPFVRHWIESSDAQKQMRAATVTGTISNLSLTQLGNLQMPVPPMAEQRRIAEVLDRAEALRAKRRAALAQLDTLTQSIFLDLFGDPAMNPKGWPLRALGELAEKMSDGPFGSNLKTSHYTETGVRVIRLKNIGLGEFIDDDKAYISERHFAKIRKHECRPGDVLVGTLGDPNLRACIQPDWLNLALNKADCVQYRPNQQLVIASYVCTLLNQPATEKMAQDLILGQTRLRISMGRLRSLRVPVPTIMVQRDFERQVAEVERLKMTHRDSLDALDSLFGVLQDRAFRGDL